MPEYLAPGVYVEETSFRAKSIEGVSTSTAGFVGPARFGPISGQPELLVSFADFQRIYGGLEDVGGAVNYLAHAVRAFFEEGGRRCYVTRVFSRTLADSDTSGHSVWNFAPAGFSDGFNIVSRFPGSMGNMRLRFDIKVGRNIRSGADAASQLGRGIRAGEVVYTSAPLLESAADNLTPNQLNLNNLFVVKGDGSTANPWKLVSAATPDNEGGAADLLSAGKFADQEVYPVTLLVSQQTPLGNGQFNAEFFLGEFSLSKDDDEGLLNVFSKEPPTLNYDQTIPFMFAFFDGGGIDDEQTNSITAKDVIENLAGGDQINFGMNRPAEFNLVQLDLGNDGSVPNAATYTGNDGEFRDLTRSQADAFTKQKNGLLAFEAVPNISIVAAPAAAAAGEQHQGINNAVIAHCERMKYRVAVLDTSENLTVTAALDERNKFSSKYAAIYYPWIYVSDPRPGKGGQRLKLPPSGFVSGIYARNDNDRAVFKAPANEVVRLALDFEQRLSKAHQEVLNPEGVNCFRFFEGRGFRLWGARTISSDPEFKYVSVRRYFAYLERSIDRGTQWAVFENNDEPLWANVKRTIEDFLFTEWKRGGLMGPKPEEAYFVRCDRSTMTQNDIDNGRLVCLIGVAPVKPAEFVIFRIGQWTADSPINPR